MAEIFFFQETKITLSERKRLKAFIDKIFKKNGKGLKTLSYVFCTDHFLLEINRKFLQHDYYTDIVTFDLSNSDKEVEGDIYISVDRVRENARNFNRTIKEELHRVIFHGALHLCGFKDNTKKGKEKMTSIEDKCLKQYFHSVPRITVSG